MSIETEGTPKLVIPAQAGIHLLTPHQPRLDTGFRRYDNTARWLVNRSEYDH